MKLERLRLDPETQWAGIWWFTWFDLVDASIGHGRWFGFDRRPIVTMFDRP